MRVRKLFYLVFVCLSVACRNKIDNCKHTSVSHTFSQGKLFIDLPSEWKMSDTSYLVSPGLINSRMYYSPDSSEFAIIEDYEYLKDDKSFDIENLEKRNRASIKGYSKAANVLVEESNRKGNDYSSLILRTQFFDTILKRSASVCIVIIKYDELKYSEINIKSVGKNQNEPVGKIDCIINSLKSFRPASNLN